MEKEEILNESIKHLHEMSKQMNTFIFERKRADFMDGLRFALKRMNTPPNLDNLLELAREFAESELESRYLDSESDFVIGVEQGAKFIIDKLKELKS